MNLISQIKNETVKVYQNKNNPEFLKKKKEETLKLLKTQGDKLGVPQADKQTEKLFKKRKWKLSEVATLSKTLILKGPEGFIDAMGFQRKNQPQNKKAFLATFGMLCVGIIIYLLVTILGQLLVDGLVNGFSNQTPMGSAYDFINALGRNPLITIDELEDIGEAENLLDLVRGAYPKSLQAKPHIEVREAYPNLDAYVKTITLKIKRNHFF